MSKLAIDKGSEKNPAQQLQADSAGPSMTPPEFNPQASQLSEEKDKGPKQLKEEEIEKDEKEKAKLSN